MPGAIVQVCGNFRNVISAQICVDGVLARFKPKDMGSRVPDGELIFPRKMTTVDLTGVHSLAPSHLRASPSSGKAIERRGCAKHRKYDADAKAMDATFSTLVVDAVGSPHEDFIKLVEENCREGPGTAASVPHLV